MRSVQSHFESMPVSEKDSGGSTANSGGSARKDKKKQAKEERDRLKQVEKKKRRLEKALATAAAIRSELEEKKQKRKEEEQRLDAEGAALAEAVALQVLVDEDANLDELKNDAGSASNHAFAEKDDTGSIDIDNSFVSARIPCQSLELLQHTGFMHLTATSCQGKNFTDERDAPPLGIFVASSGPATHVNHGRLKGEQVDASEWEILRRVDERQKLCSQSIEVQQQNHIISPTGTGSQGRTLNKDFVDESDVSLIHSFIHSGEGKNGKHERLQGEQIDAADWEILISADEKLKASTEREKLKASSERAKAAEMAAAIAAAQAVAALRIAEEARAEAEAAKKVAEAAMSQVLDRNDAVNNFGSSFQARFHSSSLEVERDELKARLQETERRLKERTRQVFHLEQNLENMTHYLLQLKEKLPLTKVGDGEISESASITDSSVNVARKCEEVDVARMADDL